jgi:hypothetical protein
MPTSPTIADILDAAADLIEPEGAWTQGVLGRDERGCILTSNELGRAVSFCAAGAIQRAAGLPFQTPEGAHRFVRKVIGRKEIGYWNDRPRRTQAEVVAKLREAAALARAGAS